MLAIPHLELGIAADVDELEGERKLVLHPADDLESARAEAAVRGVVNGDARYG